MGVGIITTLHQPEFYGSEEIPGFWGCQIGDSIFLENINDPEKGVARNVILVDSHLFDENNKSIDIDRYNSRAEEIRPYLAEGKKVYLYIPEDLSDVDFYGTIDASKVDDVFEWICDRAKDENGNIDVKLLPRFFVGIGPVWNLGDGKKNLYNIWEGNLDRFYNLYKGNNALDKYDGSFDGERFFFDANEDGKGERVYREDGSLGNPYNVDIAFALLHPGLHLKNVKITGSSDSSYGEDLPNLTNVYVASDVDYVKGVGRSEGIVEFAGLPPQQTPLMNDGKLIINKTNGKKVGIKDVQVLELGADVGLNDFTTPDGDIAQNISAIEVYYRGGVVGNIGAVNAIYYKDGSDWKQRYLRNGYTPLGLNNNNSWWEDKGNGK